MLIISAQFNGSIYCLQKTLLINTCNNKIAFINCFRTLGRGTDTNCWEWMTYTGEKT